MNKEYEYRVSVIIPVYNVERHLEGCLDSLCDQTINKDDIEVLLIDDGSTDNSNQICRMYESMYPFFKLIEKENAGVSTARNIGIDKARGKYLLFLDSDDMLSKNTILDVVNYFDSIYD